MCLYHWKKSEASHFLIKLKILIAIVQIQNELISLEKRALMLDSVMKGNLELQDLNKYPWIFSLDLRYSHQRGRIQNKISAEFIDW